MYICVCINIYIYIYICINIYIYICMNVVVVSNMWWHLALTYNVPSHVIHMMYTYIYIQIECVLYK